VRTRARHRWIYLADQQGSDSSRTALPPLFVLEQTAPLAQQHEPVCMVVPVSCSAPISPVGREQRQACSPPHDPPLPLAAAASSAGRRPQLHRQEQSRCARAEAQAMQRGSAQRGSLNPNPNPNLSTHAPAPSRPLPCTPCSSAPAPPRSRPGAAGRRPRGRRRAPRRSPPARPAAPRTPARARLHARAARALEEPSHRRAQVGCYGIMHGRRTRRAGPTSLLAPGVDRQLCRPAQC